MNGISSINTLNRYSLYPAKNVNFACRSATAESKKVDEPTKSDSSSDPSDVSSLGVLRRLFPEKMAEKEAEDKLQLISKKEKISSEDLECLAKIIKNFRKKFLVRIYGIVRDHGITRPEFVAALKTQGLKLEELQNMFHE